MYVAAAAALFAPFMTYGYAAALSETLMHFVSHCAVAAAASATKGVYDVFLTLFFGRYGILAQPIAFPMVLGGVFLLLFVLGCMLLRTYLWYLVAATLFAAAAFPRAIQGFLSLVLRQFLIVGDFIFAFVGLVTTTLRHDHKGLGSHLSRQRRHHGVDVVETPQASPFLEAQEKCFSSLVPAWCPLIHSLFVHSLVRRWWCGGPPLKMFLHCVSERTGVPLHAFYLTPNGKYFTEEALHAMDRSSPILLVMHGRLRGGSSSVPGDWVYSRCHIGGCWPTKSRCFRCGAPHHPASQDVGPALPRRESHHPGRAPKPKPAPVNPTFREPRVISPEERLELLLLPPLPLPLRLLRNWTRLRL